MKNKRSTRSTSKMSAKLKPLQVSPLIRTGRYVCLASGIVYGVMKFGALKAYESSAKPKRDKMLKEKYERHHEEIYQNTISEIVNIINEAGITDVTPGWEDNIK